ITARLLANSTIWNKFDETKFDEGTAALTFDFVGTDDGGIEGEYTAGLDDAIPNTVAMFETVASGDWTDVSIWQTVPTGGLVPTGGPCGAIIRINAAHTVDVNNDGEVYIYRSQILGTLNLNTTYQHRLGNVTENGTIRMVDMNNLPAGDYTGTNGFITATGGTLEYAGTTDYSVLSDIPLFNSVVFSGSGDREMPNLDLLVYGNITIAGPDVVNTFNRRITLRGNLSMTSGTYYAGIGASEIIFTGTSAQSLTGNFTAANSSAFYNLKINKSASDVTLGSAVEISRNLTLTDGNIITTGANILTLTNPLSTAVSGGSSASFVNGPLQKWIDDADGFMFPVGKGSRYGYFSVTNTNTTGTQIWKAEYNTSFSDYLDPLAPLIAVSSNEHWQITGPASGTCLVTGRWDNQSDITPLTASGASNMNMAEYNGADWANIGNGGWTGDDYNGTLICSSIVTPGTSGKYYTLGSIAGLLPRIRFSGALQVCSGVSNNVTVDFANGSPNYDFRYSIDGAGSYQASGLPTASDPFSFTAITSGRYRIIAGSFTANGVTGIVDTVSVYIIAQPAQPTISPADGDPLLTFCAGGNVTLTSSAESSYLWSTGATTQAITVDTSGGFTVQVTNASGCTSIASAVKTVTVNPLPIITLTGSAVLCYGETAIYTTGSGMSNYSWTISAGGSVSAGGGINDNTVTVLWDLVSFPPVPSLQTIAVNYDDSNGCSALSDETLDVSVYKTPDTGPAYFIPNDYEP
ncbi:MAG: hypothetical protein H6Q21_759, partial [Bacteroidetes bacterium]|nr:hypothetical protein [Bacteroidota bacterium]